MSGVNTIDGKVTIKSQIKKNNYICICGPRCGKIVTGVSLAFETLIDGLQKNSINHCIVDSTLGTHITKSGKFSITRAFSSLVVILLVLLRLPFCSTYYCIISTSYFGFIRDYFTILFAHTFGCKVVIHLHGGGFHDFFWTSNHFLQSRIKSTIKRVDKVIVLGKLLEDQFYCAGDFVKPKLIVVPNGLPIGIDEPPRVPKVFPTSGTVQLLYLSSLMPSKGFLNVIKAMKILNTKYPNRFKLSICGSFVSTCTESSDLINDSASLINYIKIHKLEAVVKYFDQVNNQDKEKHFKRAHIFLLPTSYAWEGQPLSIIEAMAFSTPVISCKHKGIPELIQSGKSGLLVKPQSVSSIVAGVEKIISNKSEFNEMSIKARIHYEKYFSREVHVSRMINIFLNKENSYLF